MNHIEETAEERVEQILCEHKKEVQGSRFCWDTDTEQLKKYSTAITCEQCGKLFEEHVIH